MTRWILFVFLLLGVAAWAAQPTPIPKDTLPAHLSVTEIPLGLPPRTVPHDNPLTESRVRLGRKLFFDPILSADRTVACASCHQPAHGFAGGTAMPEGIHGQRLARRAPTLLNRAYGSAFFWDGRSATLEQQALQPIANPTEMGLPMADLLKRLGADKSYQAEFKAAFPDGVTAPNLGRALASFERVLLRGGGNVDRFRDRGDHNALTTRQRHGIWLFESKAGCWRCHGGANFTDESFHNTGISWGKQPLDLGRFTVTKKDSDRGKFKTPTLRGVILRPPYMHDGSLQTLKDVVQFYNRGGGANPHLDPAIQKLDLSADEIDDLVAFLKAL
jgi:cytochrome c peroxidase